MKLLKAELLAKVPALLPIQLLKAELLAKAPALLPRKFELDNRISFCSVLVNIPESDVISFCRKLQLLANSPE
jgi:hypothetical protein